MGGLLLLPLAPRSPEPDAGEGGEEVAAGVARRPMCQPATRVVVAAWNSCARVGE